MGERMEVEVIQPKNGTAPARRVENGPDVWVVEVYPGSLTEARLRLADAAEAWAAKWLAPEACRDADEWDEMLQAAIKLAALRTKRAGG